MSDSVEPTSSRTRGAKHPLPDALLPRRSRSQSSQMSEVSATSESTQPPPIPTVNEISTVVKPTRRINARADDNAVLTQHTITSTQTTQVLPTTKTGQTKKKSQLVTSKATIINHHPTTLPTTDHQMNRSGGTKGKPPGALTWTPYEDKKMLDAVQKIRPIGKDGWMAVQDHYNEQVQLNNNIAAAGRPHGWSTMTPRNLNGIKKRYTALYKSDKPTGNNQISPNVQLAKSIYQEIGASIHIGESAFETVSDEEQEGKYDDEGNFVAPRTGDSVSDDCLVDLDENQNSGVGEGDDDFDAIGPPPQPQPQPSTPVPQQQPVTPVPRPPPQSTSQRTVQSNAATKKRKLDPTLEAVKDLSRREDVASSNFQTAMLAIIQQQAADRRIQQQHHEQQMLMLQNQQQQFMAWMIRQSPAFNPLPPLDPSFFAPQMHSSIPAHAPVQQFAHAPVHPSQHLCLH